MLDGEELAGLVERVFRPRPDERRLAILVDLPDAATPDRPAWRERREMAVDWAGKLAPMSSRTGLEPDLYFYRNVRINNADLPPGAWLHRGGPPPASADDADRSSTEPFDSIFRSHPVILAPTEFSATAPLKNAARIHRFRAATMPGFTAAMIPALRLDYGEIDRRVRLLAGLLDRAAAARIVFVADGDRRLALRLDLRHRSAHASSGVLAEPGTAGNLPSGEAYIVPYEGERAGDPSRSEGELPVQFGGDVVVYRVERNRAVGVAGDGEAARREADLLAREPAYGNIAELGLGVLAGFGVQPCGEVLLDEKLGLHVAFGRSDHFGGQVGPGDFTRPEAVVHIDRVYLPVTQPRIRVERLDLAMDDGAPVPVMRDGAYVVAFGPRP